MAALRSELMACRERPHGSLTLTSKGKGVEALLALANEGLDTLNARVTLLISKTVSALAMTGDCFELADNENAGLFDGTYHVIPQAGEMPEKGLVEQLKWLHAKLEENRLETYYYVKDKYLELDPSQINLLDALDDGVNVLAASTPILNLNYYLHTDVRGEMYSDPLHTGGGLAGPDELTGTMNYVENRTSPLGHGMLDVMPYLIFGKDVEDPDNIADRLEKALGE